MSKKLQIPYIGIKIEAIPTIIKVLSTSSGDKEFLQYYVKIGKAEKTASEYLRSLRNLELAKQDSNKRTILTKDGLNIIKDSPELFSENLYKYLYKKFPDFQVIRNLIVHSSEKMTVLSLLDVLERNGYEPIRKQTLSSYLKLFNDGISKGLIKSAKKPELYENENMELNQLKSYLLKLIANKQDKTLSFKELKENFKKDKFKFDDTVKNNLIILDRISFIHLFEFSESILSSVKDYEKINGKYFYKLEVIV